MRTKQRTLKINGKNLEIRAIPSGEEWKVGVFDGNKPVTEAPYVVTDQLCSYVAKTKGIDLVYSLMQMLESYLKSGVIKLVY